jgi:hypothetical protein
MGFILAKDENNFKMDSKLGNGEPSCYSMPCEVFFAQKSTIS